MNENLGPGRRKRGGPVRAIIGLLLIAAIIGGGVMYIMRPHPEKAVRDLLEAVKTGNEASVKSNLAKNDLELLNLYGEGKLPIILSGIRNYVVRRDFVEGKHYTLKVESIKKDKAIVDLKAGAGLDDSVPARVLKSMKDGVPFIVVKEGDKWKVDLVATYPSLIGPLQDQGIDLQEMIGLASP